MVVNFCFIDILKSYQDFLNSVTVLFGTWEQLSGSGV